MIGIDLPSLEYVELDKWALHGSDGDVPCSLTLRSIIDLKKDRL